MTNKIHSELRKAEIEFFLSLPDVPSEDRKKLSVSLNKINLMLSSHVVDRKSSERIKQINFMEVLENGNFRR